MSSLLRQCSALLLGCSLLVSPVMAARSASSANLYRDVDSQISLWVPNGWHVRAETYNGARQLRVIPPKPDQRERAAIRVLLRIQPTEKQASLLKFAAQFRQADEDREAAQTVRLSMKNRRLVVEYREGRFVSSWLWIVRQNYDVYQMIDSRHMLMARCAANASEYKTYRKHLEMLCSSVRYGRAGA